MCVQPHGYIMGDQGGDCFLPIALVDLLLRQLRSFGFRQFLRSALLSDVLKLWNLEPIAVLGGDTEAEIERA